MSDMFPLLSFVEIDNHEAERALIRSEHYLGPCNRPYAKQSFGLLLRGQLVSIAVSASTPAPTCDRYARKEVVELARLASLPGYNTFTRVAIRAWREIAPAVWAQRYWHPIACVSYSSETRHKGDVYRFDGWRKVAIVRGSTGGGHHSKRQERDDKAIWVWKLGIA